MIFPNVQPMACGGCGGGLFHMFNLPNRLNNARVTLLAECVGCKSVSSISPTVPELHIGWTEGSNGLLTVMDPTT